MQVVIAGGTGLLGRALTARLVADGHQVRVLARRASQAASPSSAVRSVAWQPDGSSGPWARDIASATAIVNLSGAGIADKRWTVERKKELWDSRILSTRSLMAAMTENDTRPAVFVQGSAVGYYGADLTDDVCDESTSHGDDFLAALCVAWEAEARPADRLGSRLVLARSGVVLAKKGGALEQMARPFRLFGGGPVASGRQYLSWIHLDDWVSLIVWIIRQVQIEGPINVTSPEPVTNAAFSASLAVTLRRPNWLPVPAIALRTVFGEMADTVLINGQRVVPARAQASGFEFKHPQIDAALRSLLLPHV
jgi:uncharacterized protein